MASRKKTNNDTARVAAAAAAAAVNATRGDVQNVVDLFGAVEEEDDETARITGDILEDLEKIDADHGGSITWELYLDTPADKAGQIAVLTRSELKHARTRCLEYGPGEYHVVARAPNGLFVKNTRRGIKISALARRPDPPAATATPLDTGALMLQIDERLERRRMQQSRERWEMFKFVAPIAAPVLAEMMKGLFSRGGGGESIKDMVAAMVGMKELVGTKDNAVDSLLKGIELAQSLAPEASKGSTWSDVVVNGLRELRPLAESLTQRRQATPAPAPATPQLQFAPAPQPAVTGEPSATPAPGATPAETDEMFKMFEPLLRKLVMELEEYAVNAAEPGLAAEALLVKVPRAIKKQLSYEQLKAWLTEPRWWEILSTFHPALQPYETFCDQVREELLAIIEQQETGEPPADAGEAQA